LNLVKKVLCGVGLHRWSTNRGGICICRRDGCRSVKLYGVTGAHRRLRFEDELYEKYEEFEQEASG